MGKIIFELGLPILLGIYLIIDILIPAFTGAKYFWFAKSFKAKPKPSFNEQVEDAQKSYEEARIKMEHLIHSAHKETEEYKKNMTEAEKVLEEATKKVENLKK